MADGQTDMCVNTVLPVFVLTFSAPADFYWRFS